MKLRRRAAMFGPVQPSHFVFAAFRSKFRFDNRKGARGGIPEEMEVSGFDPTHPIGSWRTASRTLTRAVECPKCKRLQRPTELCKDPKCKADMRGIKVLWPDCDSMTFGTRVFPPFHKTGRNGRKGVRTSGSY